MSIDDLSPDVFGCSQLIALKGDPKDIKNAIKDILTANEDECWNEIKRFIISPGVDGNSHYDHKSALDLFWNYDETVAQGFVRKWAKSAGLKNPAIWNIIARTLRSIGWDFRAGYIIGIQDSLMDKRSKQREEQQEKAA
jgi:hypothetical protein